MRIRGWSIEGFGRLVNFSVAGLPDGLTVLHGANEAGKSTLLEFLRCILFGGREGTDTAPYAPLNGARHRGRVLIASGDGELEIERDFRNPLIPMLRRPDGGSVEASELHRLLGGADDRLFRSIFAFSIDDLRSLATLDTAGVRDALFSAALAGAGRSARAAAQALRDQAAARFGSESSQINRLIAELDALRPRLNTARRDALAYPEQCAAVARLAATIEANRAALAERRAARVRDDALRHVWPAWEALQAVRAELAALEPVEVPPEDAEANLGRARERLGAALSVASALRAEQEAAEQRLAALPIESVSAAAAAEVETLHADLPLHRFQLASLAAARQRSADAKQGLSERLQRAGTHWTVERITTWARSGVDRDSIRDWQTRLRAASERAQQAQWRVDDAAAARAAAQRERERTAAELPRLPAMEDVERQRQQITVLRERVEEMAGCRSEGELAAQRLHASEDALRALDAEPDAPTTVWLAMGLEATALAGAAVLLWSMSRGVLEAALAALALVALAGTASRWARERQREQRRREDERKSTQRALRGEVDAARRKRDADSQRAAHLADEIAAQASRLGVPPTPTAADIEARARILADQVAAAARAELTRGRMAELDQLLRRRSEEEQARMDETATAMAARQAEYSEWTAWSAAAGLEGETTPEAALARVAQLEAARAALVAVEAADAELRQLEPMVAAWEARARSTLDWSGASLSGEALIEQVGALRLRVQDEAPRRMRRLALMDEIRERAARLLGAEADVASAQGDGEAILRAAGVHDEAELGRRRALAQRRSALEQSIAERERQVRDALGEQGSFADLTEDAMAAWRQRTREADAQIAALDQEIFQLVADLQQARAALVALEDASDVAALEGDWAALNAELAAAVREWRVLVAAEGLIEEARRVFERTRQPAVLRAASVAFTAVTGGYYERIAQDEKGDELVVVERDGRRKQVSSELSRGTTEQLYLSLRIGLAQELGRLGVALPLVMDDVLVNFDPERALAMAAVLGTVARHQQVLFFTCHPSTRDLLLQHGAAARVVEL